MPPDELELDLVVYGTDDAASLVECVTLAERAGLAGAWVGDSQVLWREAYVLLGAAAEATRSVRLGPAVTNPVTRHPSVTASALATLQELSGGRAALGIGLGDSAVRTIDARPARLAELERTVAAIRAYWAGPDALRYLRPPARMPIHVGASGPRMLELAGRIGDGCLAVVGLHPHQLAAARATIGAGLEASGRSPDSFQTTFWVPCAIDDDAAAAREDVKAYVARSLQHPLPAELTAVERAVAERIRSEYAYAEHLVPGAAHARLVPDEIVEDWAIAGTPAHCREQLARLPERGVERAALVPLGRRPKTAVVRRLVAEVLGRPDSAALRPRFPA